MRRGAGRRNVSAETFLCVLFDALTNGRFSFQGRAGTACVSTNSS
jgi:hypothetical protein